MTLIKKISPKSKGKLRNAKGARPINKKTKPAMTTCRCRGLALGRLEWLMGKCGSKLTSSLIYDFV
jgi:hypothetical protein